MWEHMSDWNGNVIYLYKAPTTAGAGLLDDIDGTTGRRSDPPKPMKCSQQDKVDVLEVKVGLPDGCILKRVERRKFVHLPSLCLSSCYSPSTSSSTPSEPCPSPSQNMVCSTRLLAHKDMVKYGNLQGLKGHIETPTAGWGWGGQLGVDFEAKHNVATSMWARRVWGVLGSCKTWQSSDNPQIFGYCTCMSNSGRLHKTDPALSSAFFTIPFDFSFHKPKIISAFTGGKLTGNSVQKGNVRWGRSNKNSCTSNYAKDMQGTICIVANIKTHLRLVYSGSQF